MDPLKEDGLKRYEVKKLIVKVLNMEKSVSEIFKRKLFQLKKETIES